HRRCDSSRTKAAPTLSREETETALSSSLESKLLGARKEEARYVASTPISFDSAARGQGQTRLRRGSPVPRLGGGAVAQEDCRQGRALHLPLLRRGLRPAGVRPGRRSHSDRRRPGQPDLPRPALPQGSGDARPDSEPIARIQSEVPPAVWL